MNWLAIALLTAVFFGLYNFFIKVSSGNIHEILGAVILQAVALLLGCALLIYLKQTGDQFSFSSKGILYAVLAGLAVGVAEILTFMVFEKGIAVSIATPVIIGSSVVVSSVLGILFLRETISLIQLFALVLIAGGIMLLAFSSK